MASTDSAIMTSIGSPGVRWSSSEHAGRDEQQDRDGRGQPAQDETAHHARAPLSAAYRSHTSLKRIIPSGIGS